MYLLGWVYKPHNRKMMMRESISLSVRGLIESQLQEDYRASEIAQTLTLAIKLSNVKMNMSQQFKALVLGPIDQGMFHLQ